MNLLPTPKMEADLPRHCLLTGLALIIMGLPAIAAAQTAAPADAGNAGPPRRPDWTLSLGGALVVAPIWQGSREAGLSLFPDLRLNYRDVAFASIQDGLGWNLVNRQGWKLGPLAKIRFGRRESTGGTPFLLTEGSTALRGLGNVGVAGEFGGFAQKSLADGRLRLRAEVRQGVGGHDGLVADTLIGWSDQSRDYRLLWTVELNAAWGSRDFSNVYFGVTPAQAAASGLARYRAGDGLVSTGVSGTLTRVLGPGGRYGALTLFAGYDRLADIAADSSLVSTRGRRDQFSGGLGYGYRFNW